jgi:hypothetical protein
VEGLAAAAGQVSQLAGGLAAGLEGARAGEAQYQGASFRDPVERASPRYQPTQATRQGTAPRTRRP